MRLQPLFRRVLISGTPLVICAAFFLLAVQAAFAQTSLARPSRTSHAPSVIVQPTADAGPPQLTAVGRSVMLDGSRSTSPSGAPLSYHWDILSTPVNGTPILSNADVVNPSFTVPKDGIYIFQLTINDGTRTSTSQVAISTLFTPPRADAGPNQAVPQGAVVKLDGSRSFDPDGDALTFKWVLTYKPTGSFASISNPNAISPTFVADAAGTYTAQLTVTDAHNLPSTSSVTITTRDISPIAVAGSAQHFALGQSVNLSGAASSDPNGDATTLVWNVISRPAGSTAALSAPASVTPSFVPDASGTYVLQLTATDSQGNESYSTVLISSDPKPPTAALGANQSVSPRDVVNIDGSKSADDLGVPLSYRWSLLSKPSGSSATIPADLNASSVSFIADQPGEYLAQLVVSNGVYTSTPTTVLVSANAPGGRLVLSPNPIDFGNQQVHTTSSPSGLTITNPTTTAVNVTSVLTSGTNPGDFNTYGLHLPLLINPNSATIIQLLFTPGDVGTRTANYIVNDDTGGLPNTVGLTGVGTQGTPQITIFPTSISFPDQAVGTLGTPIRFNVTNPGSGALLITGISFGGANPNDFILPLNFAPPSPTNPLTVAANGSTTIPVLFAPKAAGARSATLSLTDNAAGSPHSITLSGNATGATGLTVSPDSITFPDQTVGVASTASLVTVTNNTAAAIQIMGLNFTGANGSDFSTTSVAPISVAANGGMITIPVKFTPAANGARSATLTITDDSGGGAHTVALSGNGISTPPGLSVSPTSINFPTQAVNTTSAPVPVTITNGFTTSVTITSLLLTGTNASDFTYNGVRTPFVITPGSSASFNVFFTPKATGPRTAAILIYDDTSGSLHRVDLTGNNGGTGTPGISFSPTNLPFGDQAVGTTSATQSVVVSNPGTAALQITGIAFGGTNSADFAFPSGFTVPTPAAPITVAAGGSTNIPVVFKPSAAGARSATLLFTDNAAGSPHSVGLSGNGTSGGSGVTVSPSSLSFPNQVVGTTSSSLPVTVTNNTSSAIQVTSLSFSGSNSTDFATTLSTPIPVAAGGTVTVPVTFTPGAAGARSATLTVVDSSGGSSHTVSLSGSGVSNQPGFSFNPPAVNFPDQALNTTSSPIQVTMTNNYSFTVKIKSLNLVGANPSDFLLLGVPSPPDESGAPFWPYTLAPGTSGTFSVNFTPRATGPRSAAIVIYDDTNSVYYRVELTGNNGGTAGITLSPTSLTFSDQTVGTTSATQSITVSNPGTATLQITGLAFGGTNSGDFVFPSSFTVPTPATPLTVAANGSTTIPVSFKPTATGARAGTLLFTDNASGSPHSVTLSGNGIPPSGVTVSPASLTFSDQTVGSTSSAMQVTVTNNTSSAVQIMSLSFTGTNPTDFATTSVAPIQLSANGGTANIPVTFTPGAVGSRSATLTIADNSGGNSHTISLSGKGLSVSPVVTVTPSMIDFQSQTLSTTSDPQPVIITNNTANIVNITSLLLAGLNASDYTITNARTPFALNPTESRTLNILFTPKALGLRTGTLIVVDDSGGPSHTVALTGNGATSVPKIAWSPTSLTFGTQGVGIASSPLVLTFTNNGNGDLLITGLTFGGTNAGDFIFPANFTPPTPASPITVAKNGGTATISVVFQPAAGGARSGTLVITDNANFSPHSVPLSGTGAAPGIALAPNPLVFGDQGIGSASLPSNIVISNPGNGELHVTTLAIAGANAGDFAFPATFVLPSSASPIIVAPNGSTSIPIVFSPTAVGSRVASLMVTSNAPGSPTSAAITGNGIPSTITLNPTSLSFGQQLRNTSSAPQTITVTNTGTVDFQITALAFDGANAGDFKTTDTLPMNVTANGGTAVIHVVFTPPDSGIRSAVLHITDGAPGSPQAVPVAGVGIKPVFSITPTSIDFGEQAIPGASAPKPLLIRNLGSAPLHITGITITGTNAADFSVDTVVPVTVDPNNGTATINVTFKPASPPAGARSATLSFQDDADGSPHTVALTGMAVGKPIFSISPTSLDFGSVPANTTSTPQTVTITNAGSADLTIDFVSRVGTNAAEFRYTVLGSLGSSDFPETIAPGASLQMTVAFSPVDGTPLDRAATFVFSDNATDSPQSLPVKGTAISSPAQIQFSPTSLTFTTQQVGSTSTPQAISIKNVGGADLIISSMTFSGSNATEFATSPLAPITIKSGVTSTVNVTFTPQASGLRIATLNLVSNSGGSTHTDTVSVSGTGTNAPINITMPSFSLGGNLETLATAKTDQPAPSDTQVTVTSLDPTKILLSPVLTDPSGSAAGVSSFTGTLKKGDGQYSGFPGFWVQALASSGTAQIQVSAPGYVTATATVTLTHSGFLLNSTQGVGANFGTTVGTDSLLTVTSVQLDNSGNVLATQPVRAGAVANVTVTSGTPATGTIVNNPAIVQPGQSTSNTITFHPLASGSTLLSITQPSGYFSSAGDHLTASVTMPSVVLLAQSIGFDLVASQSARLDTPAPSNGLQVTISTGDATKLLLSTDPTVAGTPTINLQVAAGKTALPVFYLHALTSTGSTNITGTAPGYTSGSAPVAFYPTSVVINSPNGGGDFTTTSLSSDTPLTLSLWQLSSNQRPLVPGTLRPGVTLNVSINNSNLAAGSILGDQAQFLPGDSNNTTLSFLPNSNCPTPCTSTLTVVQPSGFAPPAMGGSINVTVNQPKVTLRIIEATIGKNLQVAGSGALDAPAPDNLPVTITSDNPNVLLSLSPTTQGSSSITSTIFVGGGVNSFGFPDYYIQALAPSGTATLTVTVPGYTSSTFVVTLAPSGIVLSGPSTGIGQNFGILASGGNRPLTVSANVLDPNTLVPTVLNQQIRGGFSATVQVTSSNTGVATLDGGNPLNWMGGSGDQTVTIIPVGVGSTILSVTVPPGFSPPSVGQSLTLSVN